MISHRLGLLIRNQRGFSLLEMITVLAILGIIIVAITMTTSMVISGSISPSDHMTAIRQVQNAGYWVSRDAQMAQSVVTAPDPDGFPITLSWTDRYNRDHQVVYSLVGMPSGLANLQRQHTCLALNLDVTSNVAEFIDPDETHCYLYKCLLCGETFGSLAGIESHFATEHVGEQPQYESVLTLIVTAKVSGFPQENSETRIYQVIPRPSS
jgi:prepilin-type N-terminal cleavage/methylation domain-containing protein